MRASYTAGIVKTLLENELYFDYVAGISAGASHCVNYLSRDKERVERSFVDFVLDPNFGGWKSLLKGDGYFHAQYIYEETPLPDSVLPFDFQTFMDNPAQMRIGVFDLERAQTVYYSKKDIHVLKDLMKIVRSSSSLPIMMPPTQYNNHLYIDGGVACGIPLEVAKKDGFKKFFVVLTRERGFRRKPLKFKTAIKAFYQKFPETVEALANRHLLYYQTLDELEDLAAAGHACIIYPDVMPVTAYETDYEQLKQSYALGYMQGQRDCEVWKYFLSKYY